uniref:UDP-N-acetylglucosamine transferase subunit ALG14 n=1 Tax=Catharus ustulatus TaxID=91951 RepID=A0A8C3TS65_CATUS
MKLYGKVTKSSAVLQHSSPCCQWFTSYECLTCAKKVSWEPSDTEQQEAVGINLVYCFGLHLLYLWVWFHVDLILFCFTGGHTTEILRLLSCLSESYSPRHYVLADSDKMSEAKIRSFEQKRFSLDRIPRSREVRQSWISSVLTTLHSILYSLPLTYKRKPDLILCNGPGTCVPVCLSAFLLGLLRIKRTIIVYVESICRVETLSLSGKILYYFADYFIVQWPDLKKKYPKSVYLGRIV